MAAKAARRARARTRKAVAKPLGALRDIRAELELLKRKVDNIEAEMRRLRKPIRPAFPDVDDDESE